MSRTQTISAVAPSLRRNTWFIGRLVDYVQLSKPRIAALELVVVAASACLAAPGDVAGSVLLAALVGTALVAASASAWNQWLEQEADAQMARTADRPLPAGRLGRFEVLVVAVIWVIAGTACLWYLTEPLAATISLLSWFVYIALYTPLKRRSTSNTAVGAIAGALPVLIGWTAVGGTIDLRAFAVTAIVFLWQFPHFMAIAWLYRREYASARMKMLTVAEPSGVAAGHVAFAGAIALLPVGLIPVLTPWASNVGIYSFWSLVLGFGQTVAAVAFLLRRDDLSARWLLRASLVYLPSIIGLLLLTVFTL